MFFFCSHFRVCMKKTCLFQSLKMVLTSTRNHTCLDSFLLHNNSPCMIMLIKHFDSSIRLYENRSNITQHFTNHFTICASHTSPHASSACQTSHAWTSRAYIYHGDDTHSYNHNHVTHSHGEAYDELHKKQPLQLHLPQGMFPLHDHAFHALYKQHFLWEPSYMLQFLRISKARA